MTWDTVKDLTWIRPQKIRKRLGGSANMIEFLSLHFTLSTTFCGLGDG